MGIKGLHKALAFCTKKTNIREFHGRSIAIDSSSWLHKSVYSVAEKYVESTEVSRLDPTCVRTAANYFATRCSEILSVGIAEIYLVMDGKRCPLKADTNEEREQRRCQNLKEAREHRRSGNLYKAEEKYKACIRIKDVFTKAVMDNVAQAFQSDSRVHLVWSPYEADAQLVKLCVDGYAHAVVTEDSDVLVYSSATHTAFPVLFKLDRRSGCCDQISMDWLLTPNQTTTTNASRGGKAPNALEILLKSFASRQEKRPGFGVRLFIQGCVLAGCDYAINKLAGVGLVGAFKLVRDNAFRDSGARFGKILTSVPRKVRKDIEMTEYEFNLSRSEAVFYYHFVRHTDGTVRPLMVPNTSEAVLNENLASSAVSCHFPQMDRFGDDWTFLGESENVVTKMPSPSVPPQGLPLPSSRPKPVPQAAKANPTPPVCVPSPPARAVAPSESRKRAGKVPMKNPYLSEKATTAQPTTPRRHPLMRVVRPEAAAKQIVDQNPFARFMNNLNSNGQNNKNDHHHHHHHHQPYSGNDVRFVKRSFPQSTSATTTTRRTRTNPTYGSGPCQTSTLEGKSSVIHSQDRSLGENVQDNNIMYSGIENKPSKKQRKMIFNDSTNEMKIEEKTTRTDEIENKAAKKRRSHRHRNKNKASPLSSKYFAGKTQDTASLSSSSSSSDCGVMVVDSDEDWEDEQSSHVAVKNATQPKEGDSHGTSPKRSNSVPPPSRSSVRPIPFPVARAASTPASSTGRQIDVTSHNHSQLQFSDDDNDGYLSPAIVNLDFDPTTNDDNDDHIKDIMDEPRRVTMDSIDQSERHASGYNAFRYATPKQAQRKISLSKMTSMSSSASPTGMYSNFSSPTKSINHSNNSRSSSVNAVAKQSGAGIGRNRGNDPHDDFSDNDDHIDTPPSAQNKRLSRTDTFGFVLSRGSLLRGNITKSRSSCAATKMTTSNGSSGSSNNSNSATKRRRKPPTPGSLERAFLRQSKLQKELPLTPTTKMTMASNYCPPRSITFSSVKKSRENNNNNAATNRASIKSYFQPIRRNGA